MLYLPPEPETEDQMVHSKRKHYYSLSFCNQNGYMKGKIRIRRTEDDGVYAVKTTKFISEEDAAELFHRRDAARGQKKMKGKKK